MSIIIFTCEDDVQSTLSTAGEATSVISMAIPVSSLESVGVSSSRRDIK